MIVAGSFSGGGGSSEGMKLGGADVRYACEFIPAAQDTYRANHTNTHLDTRDIRTVRGEEIREICGGHVDLWEGSPPCSSFSAAGKGAKNWGKVKKYSDSAQRTDDLIGEWLRLAGEVSADSVLMENVVGLTKGPAKFVLANLVGGLRDIGYVVRVFKADASAFGVPQVRGRVFIVGSRVFDPMSIDLERHRLPTVGPERAFLDRGLRTEAVDPDDPRLKDGECDDLAVNIGRYEVGRRALQLSEGMSDSKFFSLVVAARDRPLPTLTNLGSAPSPAGVVHWSKTRKFSPNELKAAFGYRPDYILTGSHEQRCERLCRSVCPPVYKAMLTELRRVRDE